MGNLLGKIAGFIPNVAIAKSFISQLKGDTATAKTEAGKAIVGTVVIGAPAIAVAVGGTAALLTGAGAVVKYVAPKTFGGLVKSVGVGLLGYGVLSKSPTVRESIIDLPKTIIKTGEGIGTGIEKIEEIDKEKIGDIVAKYLTLGAGAGIIAAGVYGAGKLLGGDDDLPKTKDDSPTIKPAPVGGQVLTPDALPKTQALSSVSGGVARRKRTKRMPQNIIQRVNVQVANSNRTYLNNKYLKVR